MIDRLTFLLLLCLTACVSSTSAPVPTEMISMPPIRYLALGDSYTIGESVSEADRWPNQLALRLNDRGYKTEVTIIAQTGWTTQELAEGIRVANPRGKYDLVTLLIGVNNQYRGQAVETYRQEFRGLLSQAIGFAGRDVDRVIVLSIPDWGFTLFAARADTAKISSEIDTFNAVNRDESALAGVRYVDVTPITRRGLSDPALLAVDGLHPSGAMYALWVDLVLPEVIAVLKQGMDSN